MADDTTGGEHPPLRRITLLAASTFTVIAGITLAPAGPSIRDFFSGVEDVDLMSKLVVTIPSLFIAIFAPLAGLIVDRVGRKTLLLAAMGVYGLAGMAGLIIDDMTWLLISRAVLGAAAGAIMTSSVTLIGDYFAGEAREKMMGLQAAAMALTGVAFVLIGGALADIHWRGPFWVYALAFVVLALAMAAIVEPTEKKAAEGEEGEEPPMAGLPPFIAMIVVLALFHMIAYYMTPVQLPFFLRGLDVTSPLLAAVPIFTAAMIGTVFSAMFPRIKAKLSHQAIFAVGFGLMGLGYVLVATAGSYWQVLLAMAVTGAGMGTALPNYSVWVMGRTPLRIRGRVVGGVITSFFLGQFLSPLVVEPVVTRYSLATAYASAAGILLAVAVVFAVAVASGRARAPAGGT